jgi:hypothetical protein
MIVETGNKAHPVPFIPRSGKTAMHRIKHPPVRNKIDLGDRAQLRAWTRRLKVSSDVLTAIVGKVGNSVAAVTKEIELQRLAHQPCPVPAGTVVEGEVTAAV